MTEAGEIKHMKFARQSSDGGAPQSNDEALQYPENTVFGTGRHHNSTGLSACPYWCGNWSLIEMKSGKKSPQAIQSSLMSPEAPETHSDGKSSCKTREDNPTHRPEESLIALPQSCVIMTSRNQASIFEEDRLFGL